MSYEGFSQFWDKKGHYWTKDCYDLPNLMYEDDKKQKCPVCDKEEVFENMVDLTNGSWGDDAERIDGYIKPELIEKPELICPGCNKEHVCGCSTYKIPKRRKK